MRAAAAKIAASLVVTFLEQFVNTCDVSMTFVQKIAVKAACQIAEGVQLLGAVPVRELCLHSRSPKSLSLDSAGGFHPSDCLTFPFHLGRLRIWTFILCKLTRNQTIPQ